jgi:hypothetical protein
MNKLKKLYRDFFGLTEQTSINNKKGSVHLPKTTPAPDIKKMTDQGLDVKLENTELEEAELVNKITDYQGGVQMLFADPATAKQTMMDIIDWSKKKGFELITKDLYKTSSGAVAGYLYFRIGPDPYKDPQRIQGYISQSPGIAKFKFKVKK